jgi:Tfp pilus assembly protein PilF
MRRFSQATLTLAATLCIALEAIAQGSGVVEGYVRSHDNAPVANMVVVLAGAGGMQVDRTTTNNEGHYVFSLIGPGTYQVRIETREGNVIDVRRVEFFSGETDAHRREDFILPRSLSVRPAEVSPEPVFVQEVPAEAEKAYNEGMEHLWAGRREQGVAALERAVQLFPKYFRALNQLGLESLKASDAQRTGMWCERAVGVNPKSASARFGYGWALYQAEKLPEAARELRESAKLNPYVAETFWFLGMTEMELKQWAKAETSFKSFLKLHTKGDRPLVHLYLTSVYDQLGRYAQAVESLETYLKSVAAKDRTQKLRDLLAQLKRKRDSTSPEKK